MSAAQVYLLVQPLPQAAHTAEVATALAGWHDFYGLAGGASATLVGLIFVALSLHPRALTETAQGSPRSLARETFRDFTAVIGVSLAMLIPRQDAYSLGITLYIFAGFGLFASARGLGRLLFGSTSGPKLFTLRKLAVLMVAMGLLAYSAHGIYDDHSESLYAVITAVFLLTFSAAQNAWDLLVMLALRAHTGTAATNALPPHAPR